MGQKAQTSGTNLWATADYGEWEGPPVMHGEPSKPDSPVSSPWLYLSLPLLLWLLLL
jgi:hypothetical protein